MLIKKKKEQVQGKLQLLQLSLGAVHIGRIQYDWNDDENFDAAKTFLTEKRHNRLIIVQRLIQCGKKS